MPGNLEYTAPSACKSVMVPYLKANKPETHRIDETLPTRG